VPGNAIRRLGISQPINVRTTLKIGGLQLAMAQLGDQSFI
jgi:hypothetical protein